MDKQAILIVPAADVKFNFAKAKAEIIKYLGTRLLYREDTVSAPGVGCNTVLSDEDKRELQNLVFSGCSGYLVFIRIPDDIEDKVSSVDYIDTVAI